MNVLTVGRANLNVLWMLFIEMKKPPFKWKVMIRQ